MALKEGCDSVSEKILYKAVRPHRLDNTRLISLLLTMALSDSNSVAMDFKKSLYTLLH